MAGPSFGGAWADSSLLEELLDVTEQDPSNTEALKLLAQQYHALEWNDAAVNTLYTVLALRPDDYEALSMLATYTGLPPQQRSRATHRAASGASPPFTKMPSTTSPAADVQNVKELRDGYQAVRDEAKSLLEEVLVFQQLAPNAECAEQIADLTAICEGRMYSVSRRNVGMSPTSTSSSGFLSSQPQTTRSAGPPCTTKVLAANMKVDLNTALDTTISDFIDAIPWYRGGGIQGSSRDPDAMRNALRKRRDSLQSALPQRMKHLASEAFMHVEHEVLQKAYMNTDTMCGDSVSDIARAQFFVSEDGYAWDMSELVEAIGKTNKGAMKNPLTGDKFTTSDIEAIIRHPLGKKLAAQQVEQNKLKKGVRQETINRLQSMATIILQDESASFHPSHNAVDDFLAYVATLPANEKKTIDELYVPAVDSHTRQPFKDTIGKSIRDAKAQQVCFHKTGDLLKQAAAFLSKSK